SFPAARIFPPSRSRTRFTSTPPSRRLPWWQSPTKNGARRPALSSRSRRERTSRPTISLPGAATISQATNARATSSSRSCRRPQPAKSRNSSCAQWPRNRRVGKGARYTCGSARIIARARRAPAVEGAGGHAWARRAHKDRDSRMVSDRAALPTLQLCLIISAAICLSLFALGSPARSEVPEQSSVRLAVGGKPALFYLPLTVTDRLGYFPGHGLNVEISDFPGGARALQAVIGGRADRV